MSSKEDRTAWSLGRIEIDLRRWLPMLVILVALLGLVFIIADWDQIVTAVERADWRQLPYALAATLISYLCIGLSFAQVSRLLGVSMRQRDLAVVGFVSSVLNNIVMSGGAAGYSVRFMLMHRHGVTMREVIAISILHFYLTSLFMIAMLPVGLLYMGLNAAISQTATIFLALSALVLLLVAGLATAVIFRGSLRQRVTSLLVKATHSLLGRDISGPLARFDATMERGVQAMRRNPSSVAIIVALIIIDWTCSATALWFCFRAFDITASLGELVSGFVTGTVTGQAFLLPGGLGMQEASMTGIFVLFGFAFEKAVLASMLYRVVRSIIPYLVSLGFYRLAWRGEETGKRSVRQQEGT
jgi:uncharacterized protein (TIRG00374 family)